MAEARTLWRAGCASVLVLIGCVSFAAPASPLADPQTQLIWHLSHIPAYALALWFTVGMLRRDVENVVPVAIIAITLFGLALEIAQPLAGRSRDFNTFMANEVGIAAGVLLRAGWRRMALGGGRKA